jgi:hypothetical protein
MIQKIKKLNYYLEVISKLDSNSTELTQLNSQHFNQLLSKITLIKEISMKNSGTHELQIIKSSKANDPKLESILNQRLQQFRKQKGLQSTRNINKLELPKYKIKNMDALVNIWAERTWMSSNKAYRRVIAKDWTSFGDNLFNDEQGKSIIQTIIWGVFERVVGAEVLSGQDLSEKGGFYLYVVLGLIFLEFCWWMDQIRSKLSPSNILESYILDILTGNKLEGNIHFRGAFRNIVGRFILKIIKSSLSASFQIENSEKFEENLQKLHNIYKLFPENLEILDIFGNKREKWVSLFCSEWIKQIETYLLHFSSLISSYGFSKAGFSQYNITPRRKVQIHL